VSIPRTEEVNEVDALRRIAGNAGGLAKLSHSTVEVSVDKLAVGRAGHLTVTAVDAVLALQPSVTVRFTRNTRSVAEAETTAVDGVHESCAELVLVALTAAGSLNEQLDPEGATHHVNFRVFV